MQELTSNVLPTAECQRLVDNQSASRAFRRQIYVFQQTAHTAFPTSFRHAQGSLEHINVVLKGGIFSEEQCRAVCNHQRRS